MKFTDTVEVEFKRVGVEYRIVNEESEYLEIMKNEMNSFDQVWIISTQDVNLRDPQKSEFVAKTLEFFNKGKSLMLWTENKPLYEQANLILKSLPLNQSSNPVFMQLDGEDPGQKVMLPGSGTDNLTFASHHPIFHNVS